MPDNKDISLWRIFAVFARIGAFTIGGGYAMLPIISSELSKRGWLSDEELPDIIALSQSAPGLLAVNISIFAGYRLRGLKGSLVATLGSVLPSFVTILLIAMLFASFKDNPWVVRAFHGIRPVVVALILVPMISMARRCNSSWWAWALSAVSLAAVAFFGISPLWILLAVTVISVIVAWKRLH